MNAARPTLAVHGAGRMGRLVLEEAGRLGYPVSGIVSRQHPGALEGARWFPGLDALTTAPDVLVDFTLPAGATAAARWCADHGVPLVTGTTGLDATQDAVLDQAARQVPVLQGANFSPGINALLALLGQARNWLDDIRAVTITDVHHVHKKDAPSGTALALANAVHPLESTIDSRREGEVVGDHSVRLELPGETLSFQHHAKDRRIFARGALQAAQWLLAQPPGRYTSLDWITGARG